MVMVPFYLYFFDFCLIRSFSNMQSDCFKYSFWKFFLKLNWVNYLFFKHCCLAGAVYFFYWFLYWPCFVYLEQALVIDVASFLCWLLKSRQSYFLFFLFLEEEKQRYISLFLKSRRKLNQKKGKKINDLYVSCGLDRTSSSVSRERKRERKKCNNNSSSSRCRRDRGLDLQP